MYRRSVSRPGSTTLPESIEESVSLATTFAPIADSQPHAHTESTTPTFTNEIGGQQQMSATPPPARATVPLSQPIAVRPAQPSVALAAARATNPVEKSSPRRTSKTTATCMCLLEE
jgi:hypothetical protein